MIRSTYTAAKVDGVMTVVDQNGSGMSVTNDMDNILPELEEHFPGYSRREGLVYKDSDGIWDGVTCNGDAVHFIPIRSRVQSQAVNYFKTSVRQD